MSTTYQAILRGNQLEWNGEAPSAEQLSNAIEVTVTLEETETEEQRAERGRQMVEILEQLAASKAFAHIDDPVEWQREIRKDRPLPGRDE